MADKTVKIRLKGHESFYIREGWLRKGVMAIQKDKFIFTNEDAVDELGIGANMVKSLRYWLQVLGLSEECREKGSSKRFQQLTEGFGDVLSELDSYFESEFTLALLHYKLVSNFAMATTWNLFFNKIDSNEFYKNDINAILERLILNEDPTITFSKKSLSDDANCISKMYYLDKEDLKNPEDNLISPFTELGLITKTKEGVEEIIQKKPLVNVIKNKLAIFYVIKDRLEESKAISIDNLLIDENNVGKVFNLDKNTLNYVLDELEYDNLIKINRTAGLNTVYINDDISLKDIIIRHFEEQ